MYFYLSMLFPQLLIGMLMFFQPKFSSPHIYFGVTLPKDKQQEKEFIQIKKNYARNIFFVILAMCFMMSMVMYTNSNEDRIGGFFLLFIIPYLIFLYLPFIKANKEVKALKALKNIEIPYTHQRTISMELTKNSTSVPRFSLKYYWILFGILVLFTLYTIYVYPSLQDPYPSHYGTLGVDAFGKKSMGLVMIPLIAAFIEWFIFYLSHSYYLKQKKNLVPSHLHESEEKILRSRRYWSWFYFNTTVFILILMIIPHCWGLEIIPATPKMMKAFSIFTFLGVLLMMIGIFYIYYKVGNEGYERRGSLFPETIEKEDDIWILGGMMYYNPADPCIMVPKRVGIGSTINVATFPGKIVMGITCIIMLLMPFYGLYMILTN